MRRNYILYNETVSILKLCHVLTVSFHLFCRKKCSKKIYRVCKSDRKIDHPRPQNWIPIRTELRIPMQHLDSQFCSEWDTNVHDVSSNDLVPYVQSLTLYVTNKNSILLYLGLWLTDTTRSFNCTKYTNLESLRDKRLGVKITKI